MRWCLALVLGAVVVAGAGCKGDAKPAPKAASKPAAGSGSGSSGTAAVTAMPIVLGDCLGGTDLTFTSGRLPQDTSSELDDPSDPAALDGYGMSKDRPGAGNTPAVDAAVGSASGSGAPPVQIVQADAGYTPGGASALKDLTTPLAACFRAGPSAAGVAVVELTYDAAGAVTDARVYGVDDEVTKGCIATAAKAAKRLERADPAQRCPLAYGVLPISRLPTLDVSAGEPHASAIAPHPDAVIAIEGPLVVRPAKDTPMVKLMLALRELERAGTSYVLAAPRGAEWKLVTPIDLPMPPIAPSTGKALTRAKQVRHALGAEDLGVYLSIYVTPEQIVVGLSRVNEVRVIQRDVNAGSTLASALIGLKASTYFQNRTDLEVAGSNGVTYGDLLPALDAAVKAGFVDWALASPEDLAYRPKH